MSRQNLGHHLRRDPLSYEFLLKVKDKLKIDFTSESGGMENETSRPLNISRSLSKEEFDSDIKTIPVHAQAGYLRGHTQEDYMDQMPSYNANPHEPGTYQAFEVRGDNMEPEIRPQDQVLCKYLDKNFWLNLHKGDLFVFVHKYDGIVLKQVRKQKDHVVTLHSFNKMPGLRYRSTRSRRDMVLQRAKNLSRFQE